MVGKTNAISGGVKPLITTIRIDQNISDPATMITLIEDTGAIQAIRSNSHRYLAKKTANGEVTICQLDDRDSNYYVDGEVADLTGAEGDVFMKLPRFWYRALEFADDIWDVSFAYGDVQDLSFKEWDGNDMIGAYEAYYANNKLYSIAGVSPSGGISQIDFKAYSRNRGQGYSLVRWEHHSMIAFLFFAYYRNTNSQAICGRGKGDINGASNSLGMEDTVASSDRQVNVWGLEAWWGQRYEWIDNVISTNYEWTFYGHTDVKQRAFLTGGSNGFALRLRIGSYLDAISVEGGGSNSSGYCDRCIYNQASNIVVARGTADTNYAGIVCYDADMYNTTTSGMISSRLGFRGNIIEEKASSVFKGITAID